MVSKWLLAGAALLGGYWLLSQNQATTTVPLGGGDAGTGIQYAFPTLSSDGNALTSSGGLTPAVTVEAPSFPESKEPSGWFSMGEDFFSDGSTKKEKNAAAGSTPSSLKAFSTQKGAYGASSQGGFYGVNQQGQGSSFASKAAAESYAKSGGAPAAPSTKKEAASKVLTPAQQVGAFAQSQMLSKAFGMPATFYYNPFTQVFKK